MKKSVVKIIALVLLVIGVMFTYDKSKEFFQKRNNEQVSEEPVDENTTANITETLIVYRVEVSCIPSPKLPTLKPESDASPSSLKNFAEESRERINAFNKESRKNIEEFNKSSKESLDAFKVEYHNNLKAFTNQVHMSN